MLVIWNGNLYYSDAAVWAVATAALLAPLALLHLWHNEPPCESFLAAMDWLSATILLNGVLVPWLTWNLLPGWSAGRRSLYALRGLTAFVAATALTALCVQLLPRPVLFLAAVIVVAVAINVSCWAASLWLRLQNTGLVAALPSPVRELLQRTPLVDVFGGDAPLARVIVIWWQLCAVLLLPADDRRHALALLPRRLRARLTRPGLQASHPTRPRLRLRPSAFA